MRAGSPALVIPAIALAVRAPFGTEGWFNDFHSYWLAGRLLAEGGNPYDTAALADLGHRLGLSWVVGGGYSYPLPFAVLMVPLAAAPFGVAVGLFTLVSGIALAGTVGWWIARAHADAGPRRRLAAALAIGAYPPVAGSLFMGQVNLLVLVLLAPGVALVAERPIRAGIAGGVAGIVKLVPIALVVPFGLGRRWAAVLALAIGALVPLGIATLVAPAAAGGAGGLASLFDPDPYWSNESLNGFVSRVLLPSDRTAALWPMDVSPTVATVAVTLLFGLAVLAVLVRARSAMTASDQTLALATAFTLAAAVLAAPKDSFWNHALALPALGVLVAQIAPDLDLRRFDLADRALLGLWFGLAVVQGLTGSISGFDSGPIAPFRTALGSCGVLSLAALTLVLGRHVLAAASHTRPRPSALDSASST